MLDLLTELAQLAGAGVGLATAFKMARRHVRPTRRRRRRHDHDTPVG
jgi:hypothetical protein